MSCVGGADLAMTFLLLDYDIQLNNNYGCEVRRSQTAGFLFKTSDERFVSVSGNRARTFKLCHRGIIYDCYVARQH